MKIITLRNKELHRISLVLGVLLSPVIFLFAQVLSSWFYLCFILVAVIFSHTSGVQIDTQKRTYRKYKHLCFWTRGTWKNISDTTNIVILVKHGVKSTAGLLMTHTMRAKGGFSELYLMDQNHIRRFFVHSSENHKSIEKLAVKLRDSLGLEITPYRPKSVSGTRRKT